MTSFRLLSLAWALLLATAVQAQNVGIGTAAPDASAALDIASTGKGLLVPRLTQAQRAGISSPAAALLVYQINGAQPGFWYNAGTAGAPAWTFFNPTADNLGNHTATQALNMQGQALTGTGASVGAAVGLGVRADGGLNIGQNVTGNNLYLGYLAGQANTTGTNNLFSGLSSGTANTTGSNNLFSGSYSGFSNTTGSDNLFDGVSSGQANTTGNDNLFSGSFSGASNTTGSYNLFSGFKSGLLNTTGYNNQFVGYQSGFANTVGNSNQFAGYQSGYSNTTGNLNQFAGYQSGYHNTLGSGNYFAGYTSGYSNTTGNGNQFTGEQCGYSNTTGNYNYFAGYGSGYTNTGGSNNQFVGFVSGNNNTTGSNNWAFGYQAGPSTGALINAGALGYNAIVSQSNSLVLGGTGPDAVSVGIGTTAPRGILDVAGAGDSYLVANPSNGNQQSVYLPGHLYLAPYSAATHIAYIQARIPNPTATTDLGLTLRTTDNGNVVNALTLNANGSAVFAGPVTAVSFSPSDARLKQDVQPLDGVLAGLQQLRAVRYHYRQDVAGHPLPQGAQVGVLAQELEAVYPELVSTGADGFKAVNYAQLTPVLLEAIKELQLQVETLSKQVESSGRRATQAGAASVQRDVQAEATLLSFEQRLRQLEAAGGRAQAAH